MGNFGFNTNRECTMMGFNCKMSEYAAAIGIATMKKWDEKLKERTRISECYKQLLQSNGLMKKGGKSKRQGQLFNNLCLFFVQKKFATYK